MAMAVDDISRLIKERFPDAEMVENLRDLHGEAALWHGLGAFHEQHHVVAGNLLADPVLNILLGVHRSILSHAEA